MLFSKLTAPPPNTAAKPVPTAAAPIQTIGPRGRILVVDDSAMIRTAVTKTLVQNNYVITQAENGRLGLETWSKDQSAFDLVLSDVFMPEMDGLSMAREIRKLSRSVPILLMSSKLDENTRWIAEEAGFRLLPKPFKDEVLLLLVDRLIRTPRPA
ncbi:MAG TPA: response regulator [Candidatus Didemnitutus sp.]|nr:response regulator [Candidatus Didemnitutus sp.]